MLNRVSFAAAVAIAASFAIPAHAMSISSAARTIASVLPVQQIDYSGRTIVDTPRFCVERNACRTSIETMAAVPVEYRPAPSVACPLSGATFALADVNRLFATL